jgi:hypothetical protein
MASLGSALVLAVCLATASIAMHIAIVLWHGLAEAGGERVHVSHVYSIFSARMPMVDT